MKKLLLSLLAIGAICVPAAAKAQTSAVSGFCDGGATKAVVAGVSSSNYLQGDNPYCTVTVYQTGTITLATIYADGSNTPLSNPFTASQIGQWLFWASTSGCYDIQFSGGRAPNIYPSPITKSHVCPGGGGSTIPATTNVLKGSGVANAASAATPGTDYVIPSGNTATATALAGSPTQCTGSQFAQGIAANGNANCATPTGEGTFPPGNGIPTVNTGGTAWGPTIPEIPVENYGAVGYSTKSAAIGGTDSTSAIQACINALPGTGGVCTLQAKFYRTTAPLSFTTGGTGLSGIASTNQNTSLFPTPAASVIISTSASADIIDVTGTGQFTNIASNRFTNLDLERALIPTGSAAGLSLSYTYQAIVDGVTSQDNICGFYIHASGSLASGIRNSSAIFGYNGVTEPAGTYSGFCLDSEDGFRSPSMFYFNDAIFSNQSSTPTIHAINIHGSNISDIDFQNLNIAGTTDCGVINYDGSVTLGNADDIWFWNTTCDSVHGSGFIITGLPANISHVSFQNGLLNAFGSYGFDVESSSGVEISGYLVDGATASILANASTNLVITNNKMPALMSNGILLTSTNNSVVTNNIMNGVSAVTTGIGLSGTSAGNFVAANIYTGTIANPYSNSSSGTDNFYEGQLFGTYYGVSLTGSSDPNTNIGMFGGGTDPNLYYKTPSGGSFHYQVNGLDAFIVEPTAPTGACGAFGLPIVAGDTSFTYCDGSNLRVWLKAGNCLSAASPAVCGSNPNGSVAVPAGGTTLVVNSTAVSAMSQISLTFDSSLGTRLGVTCNTSVEQPTVSARTPGTSFTITVPTTISTNPDCVSYTIVN